MSHQPAYTMSGLCFAGGAFGFARTGSLPSIVAGVAVGSLYALSGMRISEGMWGGYEGATASSAVLLAASLPRAIKVRAPVPIALSIASSLAGAYYTKATLDHRRLAVH